jgi:hypothetical protein
LLKTFIVVSDQRRCHMKNENRHFTILTIRPISALLIVCAMNVRHVAWPVVLVVLAIAGAAGPTMGQQCDWVDGFGPPGLPPTVRALTIFDDGSGPALYAGGEFNIAGDVRVNFIAKWDGSAWAPLGSGMNDGVRALTVFDDGTGPALYAGGGFSTAGGVPANRIAKWDGSAWAPLGSGMNNHVDALTVFDGALYAGGFFGTAGGVVANFIAKWDGSAWAPLGSGMDSGDVNALTVFDDGSGPALYAGGQFTTAGGRPSFNIAGWWCAP